MTAKRSKKQKRGQGTKIAKESLREAENFPLYFAFPDGVYTHVCAECDALCCRAGDFGGSMRREMSKILNLYPALQNSVSGRYGDFISIFTPAGGCVFLESDNLCGIQKAHGKALKPSVCLLFPFNVINKIGKAVVVSPHFKCPLRLQVPARPGEAEGTHAVIKGRLRELNFLDESYLQSMAQPVPFHPSETAEQVVLQESTFRDNCSDALGASTFTAVLRDASSNARALSRNTARGARVLGLEEPRRKRSRDAIDDLLIALAPPLRLRLLRLQSEGILLALGLGEIAFRQTMTLTRNRPTIQGAHNVLTTLGPALRLIGLLDEPIGFNKGASPEGHPYWSPALKLAGRLLLRQAQGSTGALNALERALPAFLSPADRSALLIQIGKVVEHSRGTEEVQKIFKD